MAGEMPEISHHPTALTMFFLSLIIVKHTQDLL